MREDLPHAVAERAQGRGVPVDGALGGRPPAVPGRAYSQWITWIYKENRLVNGPDHTAPRVGTLPLLDMVASSDVTHLDRPAGRRPDGRFEGAGGDLAGYRGVAREPLR